MLLAATLSAKYLFLAQPARISNEEIEMDLARIVEPAGYCLTRSAGQVPRFDLERGDCQGNIAIADRASNSLVFLRELHRETFENRVEFYGAVRAKKVPQFYVFDHYISRSLKILGADRGVTPYVLLGWDADCLSPADDFAALTLKYRKSD